MNILIIRYDYGIQIKVRRLHSMTLGEYGADVVRLAFSINRNLLKSTVLI